ncbi:beta-propeller domain-containing protein [Myxococcota bacterium]|nr:beta-propeller domain-containing protein [Myxococcota bacterium]
MSANTFRVSLILTALAPALFTACGSEPNDRTPGQTRFVSAPPAGLGNGFGGRDTGAEDGATSGNPPPQAGNNGGTSTPRTVEETDLYRLEGNRLYFLSGYRGLMVFDVTNVDQPQLLGRSPIYGWPVEMIVRNGVATIVVADWFGTMDDGTPFHGSIVRGIDATNPADMQVLGEARLGGWVRDTRVVGDVLYAVSEDYGWIWGLEDRAVSSDGVSTGGPAQNSIIVSSVSFAGGVIEEKTRLEYPGYGGIFHVTPNSILLAHDVTNEWNGNGAPPAAQTELQYLDISDPTGIITERGAITVNGRPQGWGADNGRWNVDFADGRIAHVVGCAGTYWCDASAGYILATADFLSPDAPVLRSELAIPAVGWGVAARFDTGRLYLSPDAYYPLANGMTPFQVYDLTNPDAPALAGTLQIPGTVWNILLAPESRIFALGNDWNTPSGTGAVSLTYLDATTPTSPTLIGTSTFGEGWAWTPAAGTFKAFTMDATRGLVVLPFSGWSSTTQEYTNGLQLIEFSPNSIRTAGVARTHGWVERGIFVQNRLVSLSDTSLSVVDYSNHDAPVVTAELTLARNVVSAQPAGSVIAEVSSDWWDNDVSTSKLRLLPIANAEDNGGASVPELELEGVNARVFRNAEFLYVVTNVRVEVPCGTVGGGGNSGAPRPGGETGTTECFARAEKVQVVELVNGAAVLRGAVQLPLDSWGWYGWGWYGCFYYDWYYGSDVVQVGGDALAFRRWTPQYDATGNYLGTETTLYVVDLALPDLPSFASTVINSDPYGWWGNLRIIGQTLYASRYEWVELPTSTSQQTEWTVRYYVDRIDLTNRAQPVVGTSINVPGILVGGSSTDPSLLYTIDYRWDPVTGNAANDFDVVRIVNGLAELVSVTPIPGWVGSTFIEGNVAYMSTYRWDQTTGSRLALHALDLSSPELPVDRVAAERDGWGWLLGIAGDRAIVSSGWGDVGVDVYELVPGQAPVYSQFVRTRGWSTSGVTRQGNELFLASGYWGVQKITLE